MTEYSWQTTYQRACDLFKARPNAEQEQAVLDAFRDEPRLVSEQVDQIASGVTTGTIRSGWAVLRKVVAPASVTDIRVTDTGERDTRTRAALNWISNAGLHFDRESELVDELFGYTGLLRAWPDDQELRSRMVKHWVEVRTQAQRLPDGIRPAGEDLERLEREYFEALNKSRKKIAELRAKQAELLREQLDAKQREHTTRSAEEARA
jgi:hypothetical protein